MELRQLFFDNPVMRKGLNLTVRNGQKWHSHNGETVALVDGFTGDIVETVTINTVVMTFEEIPEWVLQFEHDPDSQNPDDLFYTMRGIYGDTFDVDSVVTLVFFWI